MQYQVTNNCPVKYIMELFISDIMRDDYVIEKVMYRQRKHFLLTYSGLLFLLERRFETFLNVILFKQIIQEFWVENISENIVVCLLRAGMVFAITGTWTAFIQKRGCSGDIATSMEEAKQNKSIKTKADKFKAKKAVIPKTKEGYCFTPILKQQELLHLLTVFTNTRAN